MRRSHASGPRGRDVRSSSCAELRGPESLRLHTRLRSRTTRASVRLRARPSAALRAPGPPRFAHHAAPLRKSDRASARCRAAATRRAPSTLAAPARPDLPRQAEARCAHHRPHTRSPVRTSRPLIREPRPLRARYLDASVPVWNYSSSFAVIRVCAPKTSAKRAASPPLCLASGGRMPDRVEILTDDRGTS